MEIIKKIPPSTLFVIKNSSPNIGVYEYVEDLKNKQYLYKNVDYGFKECFKYQDIFTLPSFRKKLTNIEKEDY